MVLRTVDNNEEYRVELCPNQSLNWRAARGVYLVIVSVSLTIGLAFTALGFWPVLPFAGAEVLALGWAFYLCALEGRRREVIMVDEESIEVEKGGRREEQRWYFQRAWTKVTLARSAVAWYPTRLLLRSHGREVELGGFLNEEERQRLARELVRAILVH